MGETFEDFKKEHKLEYYAKGKRSFVYRLKYKNKDAILKHEREDSTAICRIRNEANWLRTLNKKGIGPELYHEGEGFIVIQFVNGTRIIEWAEKAEKEDLRKMLLNVIKQCRKMDIMQVSKEEMHNPRKHVIIDKTPVMIDFERCHVDITPKNVTQFCQFLMSEKFHQILEAKGIEFDKGKIIAWLKSYKSGRDVFNEILKAVSLKS
ncbi:MAG: hypothetical protein V1734_03290 [Nanoarchaeota archaeon]